MSWICKKCETENPAGAVFCEVCDSPAPFRIIPRTYFGTLIGHPLQIKRPNVVEILSKENFEKYRFIPAGTERIKDWAFFGCMQESISIPDCVKSIGDYAFSNCMRLNNIVIPNSVKCIGEGAFYRCLGLKSISISNGVECICESAFSKCSGLTSIEIPASVSRIGSNAFLDCDRLKTVVNKSSLPIRKGSTDYGCVAYYADIVL